MRQLVLKMDFNEEEVRCGFDKMMLELLRNLYRDATGRTTVDLVDVDEPAN